MTKTPYQPIVDSNKEEINSHLEHLFWKKDLEAMDLLKLHDQDHNDVENEISQYLYGLDAELKKDFFNSEEFYYAYKEAQTYFQSEDFEKDLMCVKTNADVDRLEDHMEKNPSNTFKKNPDGSGTMFKHSKAGDQTEFDYAFMYYQPSLITDHIYDLITEFDLKDNNQTRWCIAMIQRHEEGREHKTEEDMFRAVLEAVKDMITIDVLEKNVDDYGMFTEEGNRKVDHLVKTSKNLDEAISGLALIGNEATDTVVRDNVKAKFPDEELDDPIFGNAFKEGTQGSALLNSMQNMRALAEAKENDEKKAIKNK